MLYVVYEKGDDYGDRFWVRWDEMEGQEMAGWDGNDYVGC
jgi:hypothetical protein